MNHCNLTCPSLLFGCQNSNTKFIPWFPDYIPYTPCTSSHPISTLLIWWNQFQTELLLWFHGRNGFWWINFNILVLPVPIFNINEIWICSFCIHSPSKKIFHCVSIQCCKEKSFHIFSSFYLKKISKSSYTCYELLLLSGRIFFNWLEKIIWFFGLSAMMWLSLCFLVKCYML